MPPKRPEFSRKLARQEGRILLALEDIKTGRINSLRAASKLYESRLNGKIYFVITIAYRYISDDTIHCEIYFTIVLN
jgi:hypothetical protein